MKKRRRMVQQDLFASVPPPKPEPTTDQGVTAAAHYEGVRRKRSEVVPTPFVTGPISDATGGPLSAEEAERVVSRQTIRCSGYQWQDGTACCKGCLEPCEAKGFEKGRGYRGVLYGGAEYKGGLNCFMCGLPIRP